jgi:phenylacetate-CoA ligase
LLLKHARTTAPFYMDRLARVTKPDGSIDWARWQEVATISDQDIADHRERMLSRSLPSTVGPVTHAGMISQGGTPLTITRTALQSVVESVVQARLYHWHRIEPTATMATLLPKEDTLRRSATWCPPWLSPTSGPEHHGDIELPVEEQLRWLEQTGEVYLRTRPSTLTALLTTLQQQPQLKPHVKGVLLRGEMASDNLRQLCRNDLHCEIIDSYWRPEIGAIALRCPSADLYHLQSETCLVEVIDRDGRLCEAGQRGEVVITPLYAYAMPLVRYRTGDIAELPSSNFSLTQRCTCGRGLPAISRVLRTTGVPSGGASAGSRDENATT